VNAGLTQKLSVDSNRLTGPDFGAPGQARIRKPNRQPGRNVMRKRKWTTPTIFQHRADEPADAATRSAARCSQRLRRASRATATRRSTTCAGFGRKTISGWPPRYRRKVPRRPAHLADIGDDELAKMIEAADAEARADAIATVQYFARLCVCNASRLTRPGFGATPHPVPILRATHMEADMAIVTGDVLPDPEGELPFKVIFKQGEDVLAEWSVESKEQGVEEMVEHIRMAVADDDE
jgi:hypothetical protein